MARDKAAARDRSIRKKAQYRVWRRLEKAHPEEYNELFREEHKKVSAIFNEMEALLDDVSKQIGHKVLLCCGGYLFRGILPETERRGIRCPS